VVETVGMNEAELAEYCRRRGLYPEQVKAWRAACEQATDWEREAIERRNQSLREGRKRAKAREQKRPRKKKAPAEMAALSTLRKNPGDLGGRSGRMISTPHRRKACERIEEARRAGGEMGMTARTDRR